MKPLGDKRLLPPVRPNAGTEALYRRKLQALIREMNASVLYWIRAAYRANEPIIGTLKMNFAPSRISVTWI